MATNLTIDQFYQTKYDNLWRYLLQQKTSRLRQYVTVKPDCSGRMVLFDQLGLLGFDEKTTRMGATAVNEVPGQKRALTPREFARAYGFDEFDATKLAQAEVPLSQTAEAFAMAAGRKMDKIIIDGIRGTNYEGENGATPVSFDANMVIAHGSANMSWDKIVLGIKLLMGTEAWGQDTEANGDVCVLLAGSSQIAALLTDATLTTSDQAAIRTILADGSGFATIHGVRIVRSEQLPLSSTTRSCFMWVKSQAIFGLWSDYKLKLSIRDDLDETIQMRAKFSCNATRLQEGAFVQIECNE